MAADGIVMAHAPGRVNLIGDHTDYTGGLVFPMAIDLGTTVRGVPGGDRVRLQSALTGDACNVPLRIDDPARVEPSWARYVAGVVAEIEPRRGFDGAITTTLPVGGGLSSSAAIEVAVALALGFDGDAVDLARSCQRAEQRAAGVPCGIMDQLTVTAGIDGHALLIDCTTLAITPVRVPDEAVVLVLDSGEPRRLAASAYAERRAQCEAAAAIVGPLRDATLADLHTIDDKELRRRARHVVSENQRVRDFAAALETGDLDAAGEAMTASHISLRDDFAVSTPSLDHLVAALDETPGVYGARLTGAGFGGCVVALATPGAVPWTTPVRPSGGARVVIDSQ